LRSLFLLLTSILVSGCSGIYYLPRLSQKKIFDPSRVALTETVHIALKDGTQIHGWWFGAKTAKSLGTVIFFHGNAENLTSHFMNLAWLPWESYNYFIFDYPGYGLSTGEPTPENTVEAGKEALRWVAKNKDSSPLIVFGQSLGGAVAHRSVLDLQKEISFRALILDSTFMSYRSLARKKASEHFITWLFQPVAWLLMSDSFAPEDPMQRAGIPLLVIHGDADRVVPFSEGERVFAESAEPKEFWRIPGGQHSDVFWGHDKVYRKKFVEYLANLNP
jgi:uncharacterized protein